MAGWVGPRSPEAQVVSGWVIGGREGTGNGNSDCDLDSVVRL